MEDEMAHAQCKESGCTKLAVRDGYCWKHCKDHGIDPKTGGKIEPPPVPAADESAAAPSVSVDPRQTFECPHCRVALSSAEVEQASCPICDGQLYTHVDRDGEVFTPLADDSSRPVVDAIPAGSGAMAPVGRVTNVAGDLVDFGVDGLVLAALDEALSDLRRSLLIDLSGLSAGRAICETCRVLERIQTLRG